jgi:dethiobiotin synthetase
VVTGTGTEVGKTWVSVGLLQSARRRGLSVAARKPVQSFSPDDPSTDADRLAAASCEETSVVCAVARSFARPMAPPMAAAALGRDVPALGSLVAELEAGWPAGGCDLAVVEGAGGVLSPLVAEADTADLARALRADRVVLVADAGLGVINSVRLSVRALEGCRVVVHLNRFEVDDELHRRNLEWLVSREELVVTTTVAELLAELV